MADIMNDVVKIAVDSYKGNVEKYSVKQAQDTVREALIEANNGKTTLNYRDIRDGKCQGLFSLIEIVLGATVVEGLQNNDFFNSFVDFRNVAEGDSPVFVTEDSDLFVIADVADGTQGIRRQRLSGKHEVQIPTTMKMVRIYEELNRVLSGRVDFNYMINKVSESFDKQLLSDIYALWSSATAEQMGGAVYFPTAGDYDEDALLEVIQHVEAAASGKPATIIGTKAACRYLKESIMSDSAKEELHNMGYVGKFFGTPVVSIPQLHKTNSTEFVMSDDILTIVAGDDKMLKVVYEGDPIVIMGDPLTNADLTQEYLFGCKYGTGIVLAGGKNTGIGRYEIDSNP